jgi:PHD/YefM family antitoxin component YafN of YafNO toxin-antitoxin module
MPDGATLDISEARRQFNSLDERLESERYVFVTRHGKTAFAVINADLLCALLETIEIMSDPESFAAFQESLRDIQAGRLYDHEDVVKELGSHAGKARDNSMDSQGKRAARRSTPKSQGRNP